MNDNLEAELLATGFDVNALKRTIANAIAETRAAQNNGWIPISEQMPAEGIAVLTLDHNKAQVEMTIKEGWGYWINSLRMHVPAPTHWRPLHPLPLSLQS